jgi:alpha-L-fucosidase
MGLNQPIRALAEVAIARSMILAIMVLAFAALGGRLAWADEPQEAGPATANAIKHWQELRFGMFVHWGPVSLRGTEIGWSRGNEVPVDEYDALYKQFNPTKFNAAEWVSIAKSAGMRYMVLTTKHHDGFCLWPTKFAHYHIGETPFRRDVVGELSAACRAQEFQFSTYYSLPDWRGPDYGLLSPGGSVKNPSPNMPRHFELVKNQTRELLENYGPLGVMWFDGDWEDPWTADYGDELYDYLKKFQPSLIINNRVSKGRLSKNPDGSPAGKGDFDTPEQHLGSFDREHPWESCFTIGQKWSWKPDDKLKSLDECLQTLLCTVGGDGNLLLNVGPMPDGRIEPRQAARLREIGAWLDQFGDGVYGTRGGPFKPGEWGSSTCKDNKIFLYVMNWPAAGPLKLPSIKQQIVATRKRSGGQARVEVAADGINVDVPTNERDPIATIIEITVSGRAFDLEPQTVTFLSGSLAFDRPSTASNVFAGEDEYASSRATDDNRATRWATDDGTTAAWLEVDLGEPKTIERIAIDEPAEYQRISSFQLLRKDGASWQVFYDGQSIGPKWQKKISPVEASRVRLMVVTATGAPTINEFQVFAPSSESAIGR